MGSSEAPRDFYPAKIVFKEELSTDNYLFGIHTGPEVRFGIPIGWHLFLKIGGKAIFTLGFLGQKVS